MFRFLIAFAACAVATDQSGSSIDQWIVEPRLSDERIFGQIFTLVQIDKWLLVFRDDDDHLHVARGFKSEWFSEDRGVISEAGPDCTYKTGFVQGREAESRAAVTICGTSLTGFFEIRDKFHFFQPLNGSFSDRHLLYASDKKSTFPKKTRTSRSVDWFYNLTGDTIDIPNDEDRSERHRHRPPTFGINLEDEFSRVGDEQGYFFDSAWSATITEAHSWGGAMPPTRWVEIAVGVDHTVISFHGKERVQQYVLALMNIVSAIYQDSSLNANVKLAITKLTFYEHRKHGVVRLGNARKSLENVNLWNRKLHASLGPDEAEHDVAIWLTRMDLGGPSGYAPVGGVCDPKRSCALNKDEGLTSAFIIAHEMAHMLGLSHDGDKKFGNDCDDDAAEGSVMASMVTATFSKFSWSSCSQREYQEKIGNWTCLNNPPRSTNEILLNATLQTVFSMDEQCRMEFGEGYLMCRAFDIIEPCSHLWCGHEAAPLVCKTKKGPPLEGTECGFGKWCLNGYCSDVPQRADRIPVVLNPQDGGWTEWGLWGPCSRSCGVGVQYRSRTCENPRPSYGGRTCDGLSEEFRLCNKTRCANEFVDLRAEQCKLIPRLLGVSGIRTSDTWLPYESPDEDKRCKFSCVSDERKEVFVIDEDLTDGTPCSYENEDKICIAGQCRLIGCDGTLDTERTRDECGVCGGDGSGCFKNEIRQNRQLKNELQRVAVFPRMARHIQFSTNVTCAQSEDVPNVAFALKNRKKRGYAIIVPNANVHSKIFEGANWLVQKTGNRHAIWSVGPLLAEMVLMVIVSPKQLSEGIQLANSVGYVVHREFLAPSKRFVWIEGGWGPCSAPCGGGKRQKTVACWDNDHRKLVRRKYCSLLLKPLVETQSCNRFGCQFRWVAGKWEACSTTCGASGVQHREIYCLPSALTNVTGGDVWRFMVGPRKCSGIAPAASRACNRSPCLYDWEYDDWSECSTSCGAGIESRSARCVAPTNHTCGDLRPSAQTRPCHGRSTGRAPCRRRWSRQQCDRDASRYCAFHLLRRYCRLKSFRRLCCRSCSDRSRLRSGSAIY